MAKRTNKPVNADSCCSVLEYCIQESLIVYVKSQSDNGVYDVNMCRMDDAHSVNYNLFSLGYASALPEADLQMEIELETTINDSELLEDMGMFKLMLSRCLFYSNICIPRIICDSVHW